MKTKNILKTVALAMLMPAVLLTTSCSKDDDLVNNPDAVNTGNSAGESTANTKGYPFPVTVNVSRQGDEPATRASYNESTRKLSFSAGDKLFVMGDHDKAGQFAGTLDYDAVSGKFSGTVYTKYSYEGTADELFTDADPARAFLMPDGYESYGFFSIEGSGDDAMIYYNFNKAFALTKAAAVEQFSVERAFSYSSGFALAPMNAIVSFTISGLTANKEVAVSFDTGMTGVISGNVTTSAEGVATFAVGVLSYDKKLEDCTLTVDGNNIAMPTKTVEAGHIYNISRSVVPGLKLLSAATAEDIGKVVGADGKIYANVAAAKAASTTACAIIAYVGSETGEASPYNHGLAIAMKDAATGVMWSSSSNDESLTNYTDVSQAVSTSQSGLSNSQTSGFDNESNYPAFYAALHNTITTSDGISAAAPASGTSGWFLPSLYQWNKIVLGLSGKTTDLSYNSNGDYTASSLNTKITAAGGDGLWSEGGYMSSTEYDGSRAWGFDAHIGGVNNGYKNLGLYVRSAFAF